MASPVSYRHNFLVFFFSVAQWLGLAAMVILSSGLVQVEVRLYGPSLHCSIS